MCRHGRHIISNSAILHLIVCAECFRGSHEQEPQSQEVFGFGAAIRHVKVWKDFKARNCGGWEAVKYSPPPGASAGLSLVWHPIQF